MSENSRKAASAGNGSRKNRTLRMEAVEPRVMMHGGGLAHALVFAPPRPANPVQHGPSVPTLAGPLSPGHAGHAIHAPHAGMPTIEHALHRRHAPIHPAERPGGAELTVRETTQVRAEIEPDGVTQLTIDVKEDVYASGKRGGLVAEEDVRVVADVTGTGDLRIDVKESESVVTRGGGGRDIESLAQNVDVNAKLDATGRLKVTVDESESVVSGSLAGNRGAGTLVSQSQDADVSYQGAGKLALNVDESESIDSRGEPVRGMQDARQTQDLDAAFQGFGRLGLDAHEWESLLARDRREHVARTASRYAALDALFAAYGRGEVRGEDANLALLRMR